MKLPNHLFLATDGNLYDTRRGDWFRRPPLRSNYARHVRDIRNVADVKACLRAGPCAWPGGYALAFLVSDGAALCFDCVRSSAASVFAAVRDRADDGWCVIGIIGAHESDEPCECDNCHAAIWGGD